MGGSVIVRPASVRVDSAEWTNVGGASKQASLADELDTSYLSTGSGTTSTFQLFTFGPANLPDGAAIASLAPLYRLAKNSGAFVGYNVFVGALGKSAAYDINLVSGVNTSGIPSTSGFSPIADVAMPSAGSYNDPGSATTFTAQEAAQSVVAGISGIPASSTTVRLYRLQVTVTYVDAPTAAGLAVTGVTTTTKPKFTYTYTSPDSIAQYEMQAAAWLAADSANYPGGQAAFDAAPEAAFTDAAGVGAPSFINGATTYTAKGWTRNPDTGAPGWARPTTVGEWTPEQSLPVAGAMKTYLRVAGVYGGNRLWKRTTAGVATVAYTMAITPPAAPTSVSVSAVGSPDFRSVISVVLPTDTASRRVFVERSINGVNWYLLAQGVKTATTAAQTLTFYDTAYAPGTATQYRARTAQPVLEVYGAYVTAAGSTTLNPDAFVLRDVLDLDTIAPLVLRWQGDMDSSRDEILGEARGLGASLPLVTSDAIGGARWPVEIIVADETTYAALTRLRARRTVMSLETDMTGLWYWVRFGSSWSETIIRQVGRKTATTRIRRIKFELVETFPPPGQPTPSELLTGS